MRIKEACEYSGLTERAVRLYVSKGLCSPGQRNGYLDFSDGDVRRLKDVALLRQLGFSIDQIRRMIEEPECIAETIVARADEAKAAIGKEQEALQAIEGVHATSIRALVRRIEAGPHTPSGPSYLHIDGISVDEKNRIAAEADRRYRREQRARRIRRAVLIIAVTAALMTVLYVPVAVLLSRVFPVINLLQQGRMGTVRHHERIELPIVQVLENENNEILTLYIREDESDPENGDMKMIRHMTTITAYIGEDTRALIPRLGQIGRNMLKPGYVFPEDCEPVLIMDATVLDFLRLGYDPYPPVQDFAVSTIRTLFDDLAALPVRERGESIIIEIPGLETYVTRPE